MSKQYIQAELKREGDKILFIASDETLDRHGEVIPLESWDLSKFKSNPVLLVNHDYRVENIVGKAKGIKIDEYKPGKKALIFEPVFHEITQLAKEVKQMVIDGLLNTVSVGFLRKYPERDGGREMNELMEISFVPVPANPGAHILNTLSAKSIEENEVKEIEEFVNKELQSEESGKKEGRVLSGKSRKLIKDAVETLNSLLDATEQNGERSLETDEHDNIGDNDLAPDEEKQQDTPVAGKGKPKVGRAGGNRREVKVLKRVAKILNRELYQAKRS